MVTLVYCSMLKFNSSPFEEAKVGILLRRNSHHKWPLPQVWLSQVEAALFMTSCMNLNLFYSRDDLLWQAQLFASNLIWPWFFHTRHHLQLKTENPILLHQWAWHLFFSSFLSFFLSCVELFLILNISGWGALGNNAFRFASEKDGSNVSFAVHANIYYEFCFKKNKQNWRIYIMDMSCCAFIHCQCGWTVPWSRRLQDGHQVKSVTSRCTNDEDDATLDLSVVCSL